MSKPDPERIRGLQQVMDGFLVVRRDAKLEKLKPDDPKREEVSAQYERPAWLADAARRVGQIQAATHTVKPMHPDARGTNLYCKADALPEHALVGSHLLGEGCAADVIGNAAALDVNKFLTQEYQGKTLLAWMQEDEAAVLAAFAVEDAALARQWLQAFLGLTRTPAVRVSHTLAKQLYWLTGDDPRDDAQYHLLAPLYASSLAHRVYLTIQAHRFSDETKAAREAKKSNSPCEHGLHEYRELAVQKFGGTKPQNISQLNSERKGVNYLLASCPPVWSPQPVRPPFGVESVFVGFGRQRDAKALVRVLAEFLASEPAATLATRQHRDELLFQILGELHQFAERYRALPPGWSADPRCRLVEAQQCWLDPQRAAMDAEFADIWLHTAWRDEIKRRFGNWLNAALGDKLPLGDVEHVYWADLFDDERWRRQLDADRRMLEKEAPHA
ncbi:type I-F CRISPR-associated protein Csy1 [Megalodesulfovibrio gigas]|uniref:Putative CRISPR-associated protein, Csy1 family n=1 Tax=Megalodesulfovibrio gigas (strain ATCC 19364 / DSM 1382 / NCIMB 9332 / VKM B-1759) TaxID=1121448 RepID=T2GCN3_MEGG1|nr:type I-F CRISPR-associated protein Csy1 [Megalodesulfovibrio gigas]AGW13657.1 putative CRISPR-associated protein, Csy1 family [Megalodesulfovibrio gigas DSM 1382 = ATCC 19364]